MTRWQPNARGRLEQAALELFLERGFEQTTVAEIAQRAGLTERTFFRHFADKREVLFAGAGALQEFLVRAVAQAPDSATPIDAIAGALQAAAPLFAERGDYPRQRQAVIAANAELQERELIKLAALAAAMAGALRGRGIPEPAASLAAQAGIAAFRIAFERWTAEHCQPELAKLIRESLDQLKAVTAGRAVAQAGYLCIDALGLTIRFCRWWHLSSVSLQTGDTRRLITGVTGHGNAAGGGRYRFGAAALEVRVGGVRCARTRRGRRGCGSQSAVSALVPGLLTGARAALLRFSVAAGFYRTCVIDAVLEHSPAEHVRRPNVPAESPTLGFTHLQFEALLTAARESASDYDFALVAMLGLLGLRIFEATGADLADLGEKHGHRVLRVCGKGTKVVLVPLPPAVGRAIDRAVAGRASGPILLNSRGARMDRHAATRRLRHLARHTGVPITRPHPHMLRHTFVTTMPVWMPKTPTEVEFDNFSVTQL